MNDFTLLSGGKERWVIKRQPVLLSFGTIPTADMRRFEIGNFLNGPATLPNATSVCIFFSNSLGCWYAETNLRVSIWV